MEWLALKKTWLCTSFSFSSHVPWKAVPGPAPNLCCQWGTPLIYRTLALVLHFLSLTLTLFQQPLNTRPTQDCLTHEETIYGTKETKPSEKNLGSIIKNSLKNLCLQSYINRFRSSRSRLPGAEHWQWTRRSCPAVPWGHNHLHTHKNPSWAEGSALLKMRKGFSLLTPFLKAELE